MGRLFGTDGIRGIANIDLTAELAMHIGRAAAEVLTEGRRRRPIVVIGKDTRISSDMLESALTAGLCSVGADVISIGVMPTPAVAYLVGKYKADAGVMISASHNPYPFNGIKIFSGDGFKLPDDLENQIEALILDGEQTAELATQAELGRVTLAPNAARDYIEHLKSTVPFCLDGLHIAVDCANGSASATAKTLFEELGAKAEIISASPSGININDACGSTHLEAVRAYVLEHKLDAGIALDGDADRCLCVDEKGNVVDGDFIMAICAVDMKERGKLRHDTVVGTIMTNMGFAKCCEENGIHFVSTKVGDRYVLEEMEMENYRFGGEQSGHVIFRDFATTGDGQLTAVQLLCLMKRCGKPLSELAGVMHRYPQVMKNVTVSKEGKLAFYNNDAIKEAIEHGKERLADDGRIVVRVSGTEPLLRVMVEGKDDALIEEIASSIADLCVRELG
ncbi:MAG: phosphoglucosamine mutase [Ruthenibacterium sp.]